MKKERPLSAAFESKLAHSLSSRILLTIISLLSSFRLGRSGKMTVAGVGSVFYHLREYYPDYAYNHPVLMPEHKIYTDSTNKNCKVGDIEKSSMDIRRKMLETLSLII